MIEAQTGSYVPVVPVPLVLQVGRRLDIPMTVRKLKRRLRSRIKLAGIRNRVSQGLVNGTKEAIHTSFPVAMAGEVGAKIAFAVVAFLRNNHRRRGGIRTQSSVGVAHASGETQKQVLRDGILKKDLAAGFRVGDVLSLTRILLHEFIGNEETDGVVRHGDAQAVSTGEIPFVGAREAGGVSTIGEVLQERRIEIAIGMKSVGGGGKAILAVNQGDSRGAIRGGETSAACVELAVEAEGDVFLSGELDNATEFPAILRRIIRGDDTKRFDLVGVEGGSESRRAILRQRQTVNNVLHVVFRAAGMKNAVGFEQPSWLIGDQVQ